MNSYPRGLLGQYDELKKIHYKTLHELADAAQIIRSYEFLEKMYKRENHLLENILASAQELCAAPDVATLIERKTSLQQAIAAYEEER